jgi:hypothetical protein
MSKSEGLPPKVGHILRLAKIIRDVNGNNGLGAAALAEKILEHPSWRLVAPDCVHEAVLEDEELVERALKIVDDADHCSELGYFLSKDSSEYETFLEILRDTAKKAGARQDA